MNLQSPKRFFVSLTPRNNFISNDAFELWVLLHFEDVDSSISEAKDRLYYYERLSEIFGSMETNDDTLARIKDFSGSIDYKVQLKTKSNFKKVVLPSLLRHTQTAISRAKKLELEHECDPQKEYYDIAPCTKVHLLVEELLRLGGKILVT